MIISTEAEKVFEKMLCPFMKTLSKIGIKGDFLNLIEGIYEKNHC